MHSHVIIEKSVTQNKKFNAAAQMVYTGLVISV